MTVSSHHELSKWLASLLEPVLKRFSTHCIRDSFTFADAIHNSKDSNNLFMCSITVNGAEVADYRKVKCRSTRFRLRKIKRKQ